MRSGQEEEAWIVSMCDQVPWGQGELFDKREVKVGSVLIQTSKSGPNGLDLINAGPRMLRAHDTSDMVKVRATDEGDVEEEREGELTRCRPFSS